MSYLNHFISYASKSPNHEDQLTRALMVLLRYSPTIFMAFYDFVAGSAEAASKATGNSLQIPRISQVNLAGRETQAQIGFVPDQPGKILSVLITNGQLDAIPAVVPSERTARYDGVVNIPNVVTFIIENKPEKGNVWTGQLSPNLTGFDEPELLPYPAVVTWDDFISLLAELSKGALGPAERWLVDDFIELIDLHFPTLNPYKTLRQCKGEPALIKKRLDSLLKSVVKEEYINERGWTPNIRAGLPGLKLIGIEYSKGRVVDLDLVAYFADTTSQAKEFYAKQISFQKFRDLEPKGWSAGGHFHFGYMSTHLQWFTTPKEKTEEYYNYWKQNQAEIRQWDKTTFKQKVGALQAAGLIEVDLKKQQDFDAIMAKGYDRFNSRPGFFIKRRLAAEEALNLDDSKNKLEEWLRDGLKEIAAILNEPVTFLR